MSEQKPMTQDEIREKIDQAITANEDAVPRPLTPTVDEAPAPAAEDEANEEA